MEKKLKVLLILEMLVLAAQIFIYWDFTRQNNTRFDYSYLMKRVKGIILAKI